ncbi:MAG: gliding motility-associated C-terminal domain-containing protein, partial [Chitinophagales bacterium]
TGLCAGTYDVTVSDANSCDTVLSITITEPPVLTASISDTTMVSCNGACDGEATVTPTGGTPPYTFAWSDGQTDSIATGLCAGAYDVTVSDANLCDTVINVTITEPAVLSASITDTTMVSCNGECDASATVTPAGGTGPYSYIWSDGQTDSIATGLCVGNFSVTVSDANLCDTIINVTITEPAVLTASITDTLHLVCNGECIGEATVTPSGGTAPYTFAWSDGQTDSIATSLCAGTYDVTVSDANGCDTIINVDIIEPPLLTASISDTVMISCGGLCDGSATATPTGGTPPYTFAWSDGQTDSIATGLCAGAYDVTVSDANACDTVISVTITEPPVLTALISDTTMISCNGTCDGEATVTPSGGTSPYAFAWSDGQTDSIATGLCADFYTVIITDGNGCDTTVSVNITEPAILTASISDTTHVSCNGECDGLATVSASGGTVPYTYNWSNGDTASVISELCAGTYTVTVSDANACDTIISVEIIEPALLQLGIIDSSNLTCFESCDGEAIAGVTGGTLPYSFEWSNGDTDSIADGLCAGTYAVTVTDDNACESMDSVLITEPDELLLTIQVDSNTHCNGGETGGLTVSSSGGTAPFSYFWTDGSFVVISTTLNVTDTSNSIADLGTGQYFALIEDANGCTDSVSATIVERPGPQVNAVDITSSTCMDDNGAISIDASTDDPPLTYAWAHDTSLTGNTATQLFAGTYPVTISDASTCDTVLNIQVNDINSPDFLGAEVKDVYCGNDDGRIALNFIGGTQPFTYNWSHDSGLNAATADSLTTGQYTVSLVDANGCDTTLEFTINEIDAPEIDLEPESPQTIFEGDEVQLEVIVLNDREDLNLGWFPEGTSLDCYDCFNPVASPERSENYFVIATDIETGCIDTASIVINVKDDVNIFIPNGITPNADGVNDTWVIRDLEFFPDNEVIILNRWGDEVFQAKPYNNDWDGTYNGKELPAATYYYFIRLNNIDEVVSGNVTIIK